MKLNFYVVLATLLLYLTATVETTTVLMRASTEEQPSMYEKKAQNNKENEEAQDDEVLIMKNLEDEINNRERLQINEKIADKIARKETGVFGAPGCSVSKNGILEIQLDPTDVLRTQKFNVSLTHDSLVLYFYGRPDAQYKRFSLPAIQMPLETLDRARDCFRLFYKGVPTVICGSTTLERDSWAAAIIEAVFCFNSGSPILAQPEAELEKGKAIKLPEKSTKEQRWKDIQKQRENEKRKDEEEGGSPDIEQKGEETTEIELQNLMTGNPKVTLNGEDLVFSSDVEAKEETGKMGQVEF